MLAIIFPAALGRVWTAQVPSKHRFYRGKLQFLQFPGQVDCWYVVGNYTSSSSHGIPHPNTAAWPQSEQGLEEQYDLIFPSAQQTGEKITCRAIALHVQGAEINRDLSQHSP